MLHLDTQETQLETDPKITQFMAELPSASSRTLLLDYDGTLAPFREDRHRAVPYPEIPPLLDRIRTKTGTRIGIITGRRAYEVALLLGLKRLEIWGCHGLSRLHPDGTYQLPQLEEEAVRRISEANELLRKEGLFDLLEFKPAGTAVHWRGLEDQQDAIAEKVEAAWSKLRSRIGLRLLKFDGGMEIRVASSNKGDMVQTVLSETDGGAVAYLGDDHTDEDAFHALQGRGLSVLVRNELRPTGADAWIRPPEGILAFLEGWARICGGAS